MAADRREKSADFIHFLTEKATLEEWVQGGGWRVIGSSDSYKILHRGSLKNTGVFLWEPLNLGILQREMYSLST